MKAFKLIVMVTFVSQIGCAHSATTDTSVKVPPNATISMSFKNCREDQVRHKKRSEELQQIVAEDQADRQGRPIDWNKVYPRDVERIKRVGEIFAEGCILTGPDYAAAALVFQHGDHPDHYLQVYLWQKRAIELGDTWDHPDLALSGLDRYLVSIGHKQLFATQYSATATDHCRCLQPIEESFLEKRRLKLGGKTTVKAMEFVNEGNEGRSSCKKVTFCTTDLKATDKTIIPFVGIW